MDISNAYKLLSSKLEDWLEQLILILPNFIVSILIVIAFYFFARILRSIFYRLIQRVSHIETINRLIGTILFYIVLGIGVFIALSVLNLNRAVTSILAGAGIIGLALGFAFQDIAANFISGVMLSFKRPFERGHIIESQDFMGVVESINLRTTILNAFTGQRIMIPNKDIFQNPMTNYTVNNRRRVDLEVGVSYGDDLEKVKQITIDAVRSLEGLNEDEKVTLFYTGFGDSSINFTVRLWGKSTDQPSYLKLKSDAIMAIKAAYDNNDIMIPFPIRTLDFGIKGGEKLSEVISMNNFKSKS